MEGSVRITLSLCPSPQILQATRIPIYTPSLSVDKDLLDPQPDRETQTARHASHTGGDPEAPNLETPAVPDVPLHRGITGPLAPISLEWKHEPKEKKDGDAQRIAGEKQI